MYPTASVHAVPPLIIYPINRLSPRPNDLATDCEDRETPKISSQIHQGKKEQVKCQRTGYENTPSAQAGPENRNQRTVKQQLLCMYVRRAFFYILPCGGQIVDSTASDPLGVNTTRADDERNGSSLIAIKTNARTVLGRREERLVCFVTPDLRYYYCGGP